MYKWIEMLLGQDAINLIHTMAQEQGVSEVNGNFTYEALLGQELDYDDNDDNR